MIFFGLRGCVIFFGLRGYVIFFGSRGCAIFFVDPRVCAIFFGLEVEWPKRLRDFCLA